MTPEGKVKKKVVEVLKKHDVYYFFPQTGGYGKSGVPDIICCVKGWFIAIECKALSNSTPTPLQQQQLELIRAHGGIALVVGGQEATAAVDSLLILLKKRAPIAEASIR